MADVRIVPLETSLPTDRCWSLWREDLPCPNRATWRVENLDNAGSALMCTPHKDGFAMLWPEARVRFVALGEDRAP